MTASEVKIFRIIGEYRKNLMKIRFSKEVRALKREDALEIVFSEIGSSHKVKRRNIKILEIKEIKPEEVKSPLIKGLLGLH